ncbi:50S ribosomal protein L9 [Candidatus Gracilibacteria bacterium]|nr:50S ribosomal protein L9 [Candidatus Gracilibacteria bacterium]
MKVMFLQHVINVGKVGEIKEVNDSYARNFLFPKNFAKQITKADEKMLEDKKKKLEKNRINKVTNRHDIWEKLNGKIYNLTLNKDASGKTFGSITEKELIDLLKKEEKLTFTKSEIVMDGHIKKLGKHDVFVKLGAGEMAKIIIIAI